MGVLFPYLSDKFQRNRKDTVLVQSITTTVLLSSGIGFSCTNVFAYTAVGLAFVGRQRSLSIAILATGTGVAGICYPFFMKWVTETYGVQHCFLSVGLFFLSSSVLPFILRRESCNANPQGDQEPNPDEKKKNLLRRVLTTFVMEMKQVLIVEFMLNVFATCIIIGVINGTVFSLQMDIARWKSLSDLDGIFVFNFLNLAIIIAGFLPGVLKQVRCCSISYSFILAGATVSGIGGYIVITVYTTRTGYLAGNALIELQLGAVISTIMISLKHMEKKHLSFASSIVITCNGLASIGTAPLFAHIRDVTMDYYPVLYASISLNIVGLALYVLAFVCRRRKSSEDMNTIHVYTVETQPITSAVALDTGLATTNIDVL
ncbi:hypothetical protein MAR_027786 [Mya arenaria]|uniref:Uncharacterized protein n=1 Tax=Mya arenaria TaxID=6604 RepID=A0ABY7EXQ9_MYAAR|nr:hypothetical protein MAR_027786 [Mya arenaria]